MKNCLLIIVALCIVGATNAQAKTKAKRGYSGMWVQVLKSCKLLSNHGQFTTAAIKKIVCGKRKRGEASIFNVKISRSGEAILFTTEGVTPSSLLWNGRKRHYTGVGTEYEDGAEATIRSVVNFSSPRRALVEDTYELAIEGRLIKYQIVYGLKLD